MKHKKITIVLIILVAGLWGMIIYKVISASEAPNNTAFRFPKVIAEPFNDFAFKEDTSHLQLNYRDPFSDTKTPDMTVKTRVLAHPKKLKAAAPAVSWSFIAYHGYVRNPVSHRLVTLLSVNGKSFAMNDGETRDQVTLVSNRRDSIKVKFSGQTTFIRK